MSDAEWRRLAWLALGVGIIVGFALGILLFNLTAHSK